MPLNFLIYGHNHTSYAQTIKETVIDTGTTETTYIIGTDVLSQATSTSTDEYLLYDGHGSTRQVVDSSGISDVHNYDAYGVSVGYDSATPKTDLRYAGEYFDENMSNYYLRARWYDQNSGRFNRVDPFSGNYSDPQSLHKYLYCHANPMNGLDPSGRFTIPQLIWGIAIGAILLGVLLFGIVECRNRAQSHVELATLDFSEDDLMPLIAGWIVTVETLPKVLEYPDLPNTKKGWKEFFKEHEELGLHEQGDSFWGATDESLNEAQEAIVDYFEGSSFKNEYPGLFNQPWVPVDLQYDFAARQVSIEMLRHIASITEAMAEARRRGYSGEIFTTIDNYGWQPPQTPRGDYYDAFRDIYANWE